MDVELQNVTLPRRAGKVFKAALFPRAISLAKITAVASDHQRDEKAWGSEVADFFLRYLGCRLRDTPERSTKSYLEALDRFVKRQRYLLAGLADLSSPSTQIDPRHFSNQFIDAEDANAYRTEMTLPDGSIPVITKDVSLVSERIKNITAEFVGNIRVTGPRAAMEDSLRQENGRWTIDAAMRHIGPSGR